MRSPAVKTTGVAWSLSGSWMLRRSSAGTSTTALPMCITSNYCNRSGHSFGGCTRWLLKLLWQVKTLISDHNLEWTKLFDSKKFDIRFGIRVLKWVESCQQIFDCCKQSLIRLYHPPFLSSFLPSSALLFALKRSDWPFTV